MSIRKANKFAVAALCTASAFSLTACSLSASEKSAPSAMMQKQEEGQMGRKEIITTGSTTVADAKSETKADAMPLAQEPMPMPVEKKPIAPKPMMLGKANGHASTGYAMGLMGAGEGGGGNAMGVGGLGGVGYGSGLADKQLAYNGPRGKLKEPAKEPLQAPPPPRRDSRFDGNVDNDGEVGDATAGAMGNSYDSYRPNPWTQTTEDRFSTFAADVDTASYTQMRRFLQGNVLPPKASVRVEEYVNYFNYNYAPPKEGAFAVNLEGAPSPFTAGRHLLKIGVKGKVIAKSERKPAHLVFLVDTSGSMATEDKLPLAKDTLKVLVNNLNENDTVALVTYAGETRDVLPPTPATDRQKIFAAIDGLESGGGTAMGSGIEMAYAHAVKTVSSRSVSRVIVLTDGDTNIGRNQTANAMLDSIKNHVKEGVTLTMVGFGMGNYRDSLMEKLADAGNGNCFYIDGMKEARRVFQEKLAGTLEVIAKDVKLQVEFNPEAVASYRLIGYENRDIADKDFRNDKVDAGEIGAGHTVTALYEVQLTGGAPEKIATVRVRAKEPSGTEANELAFNFGRDRIHTAIDEASSDFRFATAVAGTADILRGNAQTDDWSLAMAEQLAKGAAGTNPDRQEFVDLVHRARLLIGDVNVARR